MPYRPHVTVAYSKAAVNAKALPQMSGGMVVPPGGRSIERFGDDALVLCLDCDQLHQRWQDYKGIGASWDYPSYRPHVTIGYNADIDHTLMEAFDEPLVLGPEERSPIIKDWASTAETGT